MHVPTRPVRFATLCETDLQQCMFSTTSFPRSDISRNCVCSMWCMVLLRISSSLFFYRQSFVQRLVSECPSYVMQSAFPSNVCRVVTHASEINMHIRIAELSHRQVNRKLFSKMTCRCDIKKLPDYRTISFANIDRPCPVDLLARYLASKLFFAFLLCSLLHGFAGFVSAVTWWCLVDFNFKECR